MLERCRPTTENRGNAARVAARCVKSDYVIRVGTPDLDAFETFVTAGLGAVPGIAKIESHLTMKVVKSPDRPATSAASRSVRRAR
jgi:DNA-binding Lrp family transcriptional regulator